MFKSLGVLPDLSRYHLIFIPSPFKNPPFYQLLCNRRQHSMHKTTSAREIMWDCKNGSYEPNVETPDNSLYYYPNYLEVLPRILTAVKLLKSHKRQAYVFCRCPSTFSGHLGNSGIIQLIMFFKQVFCLSKWKTFYFYIYNLGSGRVAQLVRALTRYAKVVDWIPWSGHIQKSTNECINKWTTNWCFFLSLSLSPSLPPLKSINIKFFSKCQWKQ